MARLRRLKRNAIFLRVVSGSAWETGLHDLRHILLGAELFNPQIGILPPAQRSLWPELRETPPTFVLYGGTALALRLGHRQSEDFDFFSNESFDPGDLWKSVAYLRTARIDQRGNNTLSAVVDRGGPVKVSFFGDVRIGHVNEPDVAEQGLQIASLLDLTATKLKTVQQRAEAKDYRDIVAALDGGIELKEALGAAQSIYGKTFNAIAALKALTYFEDGNLPTLPADLRRRLVEFAQTIKLQALPMIVSKPGITRQG